MNPSSGESIPTPQFEALPPVEGPEQQHDRAMEKNNPSESAAGKLQPPASALPALPVDIPAAAPVALPTDDNGQAPADSHPGDTARDTHVIEKQWIDRAKKVVAQTKTDPHAQKQKMS